jgi:hypothetical protein
VCAELSAQCGKVRCRWRTLSRSEAGANHSSEQLSARPPSATDDTSVAAPNAAAKSASSTVEKAGADMAEWAVVMVGRKESAAATRWRVSALLARSACLSGASGRASGVCWERGSDEDGVSRVLVSLAARTFSFFQLSPLPQQLSCTALSAV